MLPFMPTGVSLLSLLNECLLSGRFCCDGYPPAFFEKFGYEAENFNQTEKGLLQQSRG
jgi:hypothetical protein